MDQAPDFLLHPHQAELSERVYQPSPPERRGETLAWLCTGGVLLAGLIVQLASGSFPELAAGLAATFGLAAALITFGNWMESGTSIRISRRGIHYRSPLRNVASTWDEVQRLRAAPLRQGWRIAVTCHGGRFLFRTAGRLELGSSESMLLGIQGGRELVETIVKRAQLNEIVADEGAWIATRSSAYGASADAEGFRDGQARSQDE